MLDQTQGFVCAGQALYHLSYIPNTKFVIYKIIHDTLFSQILNIKI